MSRAAPSRRLNPLAAGVVVTIAVMAFSSTAVVVDVQHGLGDALRPIVGAVAHAVRTVGSVVGAVGDVDRVRTANDRLRRDNDRLAAENRRLEEIRRQNERLTELLRLRDGFGYEAVAAEVIAAEPSGLRHVVTIGRGTRDGIAPGDVVIGEGGTLVGRVFDVGGTYAHVALITDASSIVIGRLPGGATGAVVGAEAGVIVMDRIDTTADVKPGDAVVTAGIELEGGIRSAYPKGLVIGQVVDVKRDPNAVVQTAWLIPAAPLDRLEYVLAITGYEGGLPSIAPEP